MIKIERRSTGKAQRAIAALQEAKQRNSTYNTSEVNEANGKLSGIVRLHTEVASDKSGEAVITGRAVGKWSDSDSPQPYLFHKAQCQIAPKACCTAPSTGKTFPSVMPHSLKASMRT